MQVMRAMRRLIDLHFCSVVYGVRCSQIQDVRKSTLSDEKQAGTPDSVVVTTGVRSLRLPGARKVASHVGNPCEEDDIATSPPNELVMLRASGKGCSGTSRVGQIGRIRSTHRIQVPLYRHVQI